MSKADYYVHNAVAAAASPAPAIAVTAANDIWCGVYFLDNLFSLLRTLLSCINHLTNNWIIFFTHTLFFSQSLCWL